MHRPKKCSGQNCHRVYIHRQFCKERCGLLMIAHAWKVLITHLVTLERRRGGVQQLAREVERLNC